MYAASSNEKGPSRESSKWDNPLIHEDPLTREEKDLVVEYIHDKVSKDGTYFSLICMDWLRARGRLLTLFVEELKTLSQLTMIRLSNSIGPRGVDWVVEVLPVLENLTHLNLDFEAIDSQGIETLFKVLPCTSVTALSLVYSLCDGGVRTILGMLSSGTNKLVSLDLRGNCTAEEAECYKQELADMNISGLRVIF